MPQYDQDDVRLEEVELGEDDDHWSVTFSAPGKIDSASYLMGQVREPKFGKGRVAKIVTLRASDGRFISVKQPE